MKLLKFALGLALMILMGFGALLIVAPFSDGSLAIIAGGPLVSGELVSDELVSDEVIDWRLVRDVPTVELNRKYAAGMRVDDVESGSLWFFELEPQGGAER